MTNNRKARIANDAAAGAEAANCAFVIGQTVHGPCGLYGVITKIDTVRGWISIKNARAQTRLARPASVRAA